MQIVVADTGPLHYLVLIEAIEVLPRLFGTVFVPAVVRSELDREETPSKVRQWITAAPPWLKVCPAPEVQRPRKPGAASLDEGELEAIILAEQLHADLILMDERAGVAFARAEGFTVMGTLGVLNLAARAGMVDLAETFALLRKTSFRCQQAIFDRILAQYEADRIVP